MEEVYDRLQFKWMNGQTVAALVLLKPLPDGRTLVVCRDDNDRNPVIPVNMAIEELVKMVSRLHNLSPSKIFWIEASESLDCGRTPVGGWERVIFPSGTDEDYRWVRMTDADWLSLGISPLPQY